MIRGSNTLPQPLNILIKHSLQLCELILPFSDHIYPFAATYENGKIECLFNNERFPYINEGEAIEQLHRHIIHATQDTRYYAILVYCATVETQKHTTLNAIAINLISPYDEDQVQLYPYYRVGSKIVVSPPINTMPE